MTDDRKLLELAAKAAGIEIDSWSTYGPYIDGLERLWWNPLTDDGDALRLAVKLSMNIIIMQNIGASARADQTPSWVDENADPKEDLYAATRIAIVRAAAAIGEKI
jgi:hypothetical protein